MEEGGEEVKNRKQNKTKQCDSKDLTAGKSDGQVVGRGEGGKMRRHRSDSQLLVEDMIHTLR